MGGKPGSWREFRVGEEARRARMLAQTLKCLTSTCATDGAGRGGGGNVGLDMLAGTIGIYQLESHRSLLPDIGEMNPLGGQKTCFTVS